MGVYDVKHDGKELKKRSNAIDGKFCDPKKGNKQFHRWEYWGFEDLFILHYTGDHSVFQNFKHRNSKKETRPFIRSAPFVKEKVDLSYKHVIIVSYTLLIYRSRTATT